MSRALALCCLLACGNDKQPVRDAASIPDASLYPPCADPRAGTAITFREIGRVAGDGAVLATGPELDPRLFVVEQRGAIRIFANGALLDEPFLDISQAAGGPVTSPTYYGDEKGLLGLAFHPQYAMNRQFFVFFTTSRTGDFYDVLWRCEASVTDPNRADPATCIDVLVIRDPYTNHNGGMLSFGPDGYLYIGTGDGGGGSDPFRYPQNPNALLGKMLRIDVDRPEAGKPYGIPPTNPFAVAGGAPEVFMLGLRNPWRWSFDRATGDIWIGDVGQQLVEELNVLRPAQQPGANLGWSTYEGNNCCVTSPYQCESAAPAENCDPTGFVFPKDSRFPLGGELGWRAIIAGDTYRGSCYADLYGWFFYTDWNQRDLIRARLKDDDTLEIVETGLQVPGNPSSLHGDGLGELHLTNTDGYVYRLEVAP